MGKAHGHVTHEDKEWIYGYLKPGQVEGVQCPFCGTQFVVFATAGVGQPLKPIPVSGNVNYFCPCCGKNLKDTIAILRARVDGRFA